MKLKNKILIVILLIGIYIIFGNVSYAGTQRLNSINYDAKLNVNGSMDIVETWDIYVSETNTLFKDFDLDSSKYSGITNVKVKDLSYNKNFTQINEEMYHVTKDCYYGLPISDGEFEIAWGVGLDNSSANRRYQISYTVEDVIAIYNDCSELYWQFIGTDNGIKADRVTGKIKLPRAVEDIETLRVWAHGPLTGEINKISEDTVEFHVDDLSANTMLETRVVVQEKMFNSGRKKATNELANILKEETKWANEANRKRMKARLLIGVIVVGYIGLFLFFLKKIFKYAKELKEIKQEASQNVIDIGKYFRDIPREKESTPSQAAFLYYSNKNSFSLSETVDSKIFSATLLQLCLKGKISLDKKDKDIYIELHEDNQIQLKKDEDIIFKLLQKASKNNENVISMKDLKKYAKNKYDNFHSDMKAIRNYAKNAYIENGEYSKEQEKIYNKARGKSGIYIFLSIMLLCFGIGFVMIPHIIEFIICVILINKTASYIPVLTEQGEIERQEWKGLKKYMEDFSLLKERDIPELVLWEKYLVYATAFGISEKVIKQLKVVYPDFNNMNNNTYTYMYLMNDLHFGGNFINEFNKGMNSVYNSYKSAYSAAHSSSSSGSGGGGGFSGGGGGRRRRWPEWEVDKMKIGIDIGGSHIGIGLIQDSKIISSKEKNFNREDRKDIQKTIIATIDQLVSELLKENNLNIEQIELIGIAAPGTISNGVIVKAGNLNIKNFPIIERLKEIYNNPILIRNDAKCAALAEKVYGSMKEYDDCIFINIGTGIGGAAFLGGKLLEPKRYSGFEFGHMILNKGGRLCSCGKQGCFEAYSSIKALKMKVAETLDVDSDISGQYLREELLVKDNPGVKEDIDVFLEYLKTGISNLIDIFEPEVVCLGGSFAYYEGNPVLDKLIQKLNEENSTFNNGDLPEIVTAKLKNDAGIIGAVIE